MILDVLSSVVLVAIGTVEPDPVVRTVVVTVAAPDDSVAESPAFEQPAANVPIATKAIKPVAFNGEGRGRVRR